MESSAGQDEATAADWAEALREAHAALRVSTTARERERWRGRAWEILAAALARALRGASARLGGVDDELLRDIASEKALDLLLRLDRDEWAPAERHPAQLSRFVGQVARNGLVDALRREGRMLRPEDFDELPDPVEPPPAPTTPLDRVQHEAFVEALVGCAGALRPRARRAWFLRAVHELPSADIATDPAVQARASAVDMMLSRARQELRRCLEAQGFDRASLAPGVLVALWGQRHRLAGEEGA